MHNGHIFLLCNHLCIDTALAKSLEEQKQKGKRRQHAGFKMSQNIWVTQHSFFIILCTFHLGTWHNVSFTIYFLFLEYQMNRNCSLFHFVTVIIAFISNSVRFQSFSLFHMLRACHLPHKTIFRNLTFPSPLLSKYLPLFWSAT